MQLVDGKGRSEQASRTALEFDMNAFAALALLALAPVQERPALLPPTPENWRFERLEFPLSFAPELKLKGYEELRFAPWVRCRHRLDRSE